MPVKKKATWKVAKKTKSTKKPVAKKSPQPTGRKKSVRKPAPAIPPVTQPKTVNVQPAFDSTGAVIVRSVDEEKQEVAPKTVNVQPVLESNGVVVMKPV